MNGQRYAPLAVIPAIGPLYARVLGNPMVHVRLGAPFLVILVALDLLLFAWLGPLDDPINVQRLVYFEQDRFVVAMALFTLVTIWVSTLYAVRWHRYSLLGQSEYRFLDIAPKARDWAYFGYSVLVGIVIGVVAFALSFVATSAIDMAGLGGTFIRSLRLEGPSAYLTTAGGVLMIAIIALPCLYLFARWSLVFPGRAIEVQTTLTHSWMQSRGQGWRIAGLIMAMVLPVQILGALVPGLLPFQTTGFVWTTQLVTSVVINFFLLITIALGQSALSHAYAHLGRIPGSPSPSGRRD